MPISMGIPGYEISQQERVGMLIAAVGGPVKAAALIGRSRSHIDNMRKPDAVLRLDDLLVLCREAGVSLDWVATGYQVRSDLAGDSSNDVQGLSQVQPVRAGAPKSELAVSVAWLERRGLSLGTARYAVLDDDGMGPRLARGATVIVDASTGTLRSGIYLVATGDELIARRLKRMPDNSTELTADNDPSWRFILPATGETPQLHRIVWAGQDV